MRAQARAAICLVGGLMAALAMTLIAGSPATAAPFVIGGTPAHPLSGASVALATPSEYCTGGLWKSRIIITAAHCINGDGRGAPGAAPGLIEVYAPGGDRNAGPARVKVVEIIYDQGWSDTKDDIAFLILDSPLATPIVTRMATPTEVAAFAAQRNPVTYIGYGLTSPRAASGTVSDQPLAVTEQLRPSYTGNGKGTFEMSGNGVIGTCAGDSGGPWLAQVNGEVLYLGPLSGGSGLPCDSPESPDGTFEEAAVASAQTDLISRALAAAGELADGQVGTCIEGPDVERACVSGHAWTYDYCWPGAKAVLQKFVDGAWQPVARTTAKKEKACGSKYPYNIVFQKADEPGTYQYRVVLPKQSGVRKTTTDRFTVTVT